MTNTLQTYFDAAYPLLFIESADDSKLSMSLADADHKVMSYSANGLLVDHTEGGGAVAIGGYSEAFGQFSSQQRSVLIVRDLQSLITNPGMYRALLDVTPALRMNGSCIICVAPRWRLPLELNHAGPVIDLPLPDRAELTIPLDQIIDDTAGDGVPEVDSELRDKLLDAAAGLTLSEAENAFALAVAEKGEFDFRIVAREKMRLIAATGFLQVETPARMEDIGGMDLLKQYIRDEVLPMVRDDQLAVRGIILAGLPGLGKSLASKAFGAALEWPIIRFDVPAAKAGIVGESEANIRMGTNLIEAASPCVLWIDEVEKAIGGSSGASAASDGGTSLGMLGHLLTWLQEHRSPIFTVATCNDYDSLPAAFTRCGRFDERFFVDLPGRSEREEIAGVHLSRFGCDVDLAASIADHTDQHTGAEIEQLIKSAARLSQRNIDDAAIARAAKSIRPVAKVDSERTGAERGKYASKLRPANSLEQAGTKSATKSRRITKGKKASDGK